MAVCGAKVLRRARGSAQGQARITPRAVRWVQGNLNYSAPSEHHLRIEAMAALASLNSDRYDFGTVLRIKRTLELFKKKKCIVIFILFFLDREDVQLKEDPKWHQLNNNKSLTT